MPFRVRRKLLSDSEFLALSVPVRETFISAFHSLAFAEDPMQRGRDWYVEETRQNQKVASEGLSSLPRDGALARLLLPEGDRPRVLWLRAAHWAGE